MLVTLLPPTNAAYIAFLATNTPLKRKKKQPRRYTMTVQCSAAKRSNLLVQP